MEIYFNPYPGAAKNEIDGMQCIVKVADAFARLQTNLHGIPLPGVVPNDDVDVSPANFVLIRNVGAELRLGDIIYKASSAERTKLQLLLQTFSRGRVIDAGDFSEVDDWIITNIQAPAPVLALAAQNKAIALTIPTEIEWCVDILYFDKHMETLHNLWGQADISKIAKYCIESLKNFILLLTEAQLNDLISDGEWIEL
jgi:hypothetical protein